MLMKTKLTVTQQFVFILSDLRTVCKLIFQAVCQTANSEIG